MDWKFRFLFGNGFCMDAASGDGAQGGGGGGGANGDAGQKGGQGSPDLAKQLADEKARNDKLEERLKALEGKGGASGGSSDQDLADKARAARDAASKNADNEKRLESALKFSIAARDWAKTNAPLLPKTIDSILDAADKEVYGSAIEKDGAIKSGIISEFFALQSNLDLLTPSQKSVVEEFAKLTKNVKQERAQQVYESIFEPTFEMIRRIRKAEQLSKGGAVNQTDAEAAYKDKLIGLSQKHYLGEKR